MLPLPLPLSLFFFIYLSVCLSVYLFVCLFIYLFIYLWFLRTHKALIHKWAVLVKMAKWKAFVDVIISPSMRQGVQSLLLVWLDEKKKIEKEKEGKKKRGGERSQTVRRKLHNTN